MAGGQESAGGGARAKVAGALGNLAVRPDLGGRRGIGVGAFVLALVTAGAMAHVGVRMKGIEVAYELGREKRVNTQLEEERRRLNIEIGMLKDPVRIVSFARDKLKMGPPAPGDIVRLTPGQVLGAHAEAAAAPPARGDKVAAKPTTKATNNKPSAAAKAPRPAKAPAAEAPVEEREAEPAPDLAKEADE